MFAATSDIAVRFGQELTDNEELQAAQLLISATGLIAEAADKDDAWADALDPIPSVLKALCIEVVCRTMANPSGSSYVGETVGEYSYSQRFGAGLMLTANESAMVRRTVALIDEVQTSGSAVLESLITDIPLANGGWPYGQLVSLDDLGETDPAYWLPER